MYYFYIENNKIIGAGSCECTSDTVINKEISSHIFQNFELYGLNYYSYSNGEIILNLNYQNEIEQNERKRLNKLSLTKREVFLAVYKDKGILPENIRNMITDDEKLIEFDYSERFYRGNPLITELGNTLGYSSQQLDDLFINGKFN